MGKVVSYNRAGKWYYNVFSISIVNFIQTDVFVNYNGLNDRNH